MYRANTLSVRSSPALANLQAQERPQPKAIKLTAREKELLHWTAVGKSSWEIAQIVQCTEAGVNYHFCNIRRKFGVRSRWIAMMMALDLGLIKAP
ncbi:LuxR C-terminal-related transcriptional regulator [Pseudomonas sp. WJP1]|uniref:LuxR C-terminal-related transcriptional regulator n=1 Tax=Pseudomonas sp. WJP1 TaxID=2986947 RepID=UPI00234BFF90|nr:LuxR C-terminal-related transcriptional regulator [Pseudomonas sp. WJP1]